MNLKELYLILDLVHHKFERLNKIKGAYRLLLNIVTPIIICYSHFMKTAKLFAIS